MFNILHVAAHSIFIITLALLLSLLFNGLERKLIARMQARIGPPIIQPFLDIKKLFIKENIVPANSIKWLFNAMPLVALASALLLFLYMPFAGMPPLLQAHGDLILVLYLFIIPPLALAIGAFASASPYASIGAQREIVLMMSYEFVLSVVVIAFAWLLSFSHAGAYAFSFDTLTAYPIWNLVDGIGKLGVALLLVSALAVFPAKVAKLPADISEAKTEIAEGVLVEYSGRNLALLLMAQAAQALAFASLIVALFFPWNISAFLALPSIFALIADFIFFLVKTFAIMFASLILVSAATARLKVDQAARIYIYYVFLLALFGLAFIGLDRLLVM